MRLRAGESPGDGELVLESRPAASDADHDPVAFADARRQTPDQRVEEGLAWMRLSVQ
jgi:hypothetical protein